MSRIKPKGRKMTYTSKFGIALVTALVATPVFAGDRVMDQIRLQLRDMDCVAIAEEIVAEDETLSYDQVRERLQLRDCTCFTDDECTGDQLRTRTRTGADNGQGAVNRERNGDGHN